MDEMSKTHAALDAAYELVESDDIMANTLTTILSYNQALAMSLSNMADEVGPTEEGIQLLRIANLLLEVSIWGRVKETVARATE